MYAKSTIRSNGRSLRLPHKGEVNGMSRVTLLCSSDLLPGKHVPSPKVWGVLTDAGVESPRSLEEPDEKDLMDREDGW